MQQQFQQNTQNAFIAFKHILVDSIHTKDYMPLLEKNKQSMNHVN